MALAKASLLRDANRGRGDTADEEVQRVKDVITNMPNMVKMDLGDPVIRADTLLGDEGSNRQSSSIMFRFCGPMTSAMLLLCQIFSQQALVASLYFNKSIWIQLDTFEHISVFDPNARGRCFYADVQDDSNVNAHLESHVGDM